MRQRDGLENRFIAGKPLIEVEMRRNAKNGSFAGMFSLLKTGLLAGGLLLACRLCADTGDAPTVTQATLSFLSDDGAAFFLNGTTVTASPVTQCAHPCYKAITSVTITAAMFGQSNILGVYSTDSGTAPSGISWDLQISYTDGCTQDVESDGTNTWVCNYGSAAGDSGETSLTIPDTGDYACWYCPSYVTGTAWATGVISLPGSDYCDSATWNGMYVLNQAPDDGDDLTITDAAGNTVDWLTGWAGFTDACNGATSSQQYLFLQKFSLQPAHCWTPTATSTATPSVTATVTATPSGTATATASWTATATFTDTGTQTSTFTLSNTGTYTATMTATPTATGSDSATATWTSTGTDSATVSDSPTPSATVTATPSATASATETEVSFTATPSATASATETEVSFTATPSSTGTGTGTPTATDTVVSFTPTPTPTVTASDMPTEAPPASPSPTGVIVPVSATFSPTFVAASGGPFTILAVYPHPVPASGTVFAVRVPDAGTVELDIYTLKGEKVVALEQTYALAGAYEMPWDANNNDGNPVAFGSYYVMGHYTGSGTHAKAGRWISVVR